MVTLERLNENERLVTADTRKFTIRRSNGDQLWTVHTEVGVLPRELRGSFTSPETAKQYIENYAHRVQVKQQRVK